MLNTFLIATTIVAGMNTSSIATSVALATGTLCSTPAPKTPAIIKANPEKRKGIDSTEVILNKPMIIPIIINTDTTKVVLRL